MKMEKKIREICDSYDESGNSSYFQALFSGCPDYSRDTIVTVIRWARHHAEMDENYSAIADELENMISTSLDRLGGFSGKDEYHSSWSDTKVWAYEVLSKQYAGMLEDFDDNFEVAWYWFCYHYHEGQWSDLYSDMSNSLYSPGPMMTLEKEPYTVQMLYEDMIDFVED